MNNLQDRAAIDHIRAPDLLACTRHVEISLEILVRSIRYPRDTHDAGPLSACPASRR